MFTEVKKHIKLIFKYFAFNLSALAEYRTSFIVQVFGMALNNASFAFFWWVLFSIWPVTSPLRWPRQMRIIGR